MSQQYKQEKKNLRNTINSFISPSHDRRLTIAIYYKITKLRQLFIKNNLHQDTSNSYVAYQYTCPMDGCNPSQIYIGYTYNHFPKAENDITHTNRSHIRTQQKTVHQHRINTAKMLNAAKYFTLIRQGDIDHGSTYQTAQPTSQQSTVMEIPAFFMSFDCKFAILLLPFSSYVYIKTGQFFIESIDCVLNLLQ